MTGDVSELPFELPAWRWFSVSADQCKGLDCQFSEGCNANVARARASQGSRSRVPVTSGRP